jgi:hypothetical protein
VRSVPSPADRLAGMFTENHGPDCDPRSGRWDCDPHWDRHGLAWWYPQVVAWVGIRSTSGRSGAGGAVAVPIDLGALDFLVGRYWVGEKDDDVDDETNYRSGFVPTILGLEQSARRALGLGPRPRSRAEGYSGLGEDPRVDEALDWLAAHAAAVLEDGHELFAETVRDEALRLLARATATLYGGRFEATQNPCQYCESSDSVIADEDRAVCINQDCRDTHGGRRCWRSVDVAANDELGYESWLGYAPDDAMPHDPVMQWVLVEEPNVRGRGQVTEEQVLRWAAGL